MPSYDLACESCGTGFELFRQRFLRPEEKVCPECGGPSRIVLSAFQTSAPGADTRRTTTVNRVMAPSCGCGHVH